MALQVPAAWLAQPLVLFCLLAGLAAFVMLVVLTPARLDRACVRYKAWLCAYGLAYAALSRDTDFQLPPDPGKSSSPTVARKRVVFVRHGESVWNACFNRRFDLSFPGRLICALWQEAMLLLCTDSLFIDSPLSGEGIAQAQLIERFLRADEGEELRRLCESAVFTCSCLRRAASTMVVAFGHFFGGGRPIWVLSCLQEISRNVDTLALTLPYCSPILPDCDGVPPISSSQTLQAAFNTGNKGLDCHGAHRLEAFCGWVFAPAGPAALQPNVVVAGHSLWFRTFFQAYMPHTAYHQCKHAKIVNCGVVAFDLEMLQCPDGGPPEYRVVPESVTTIYGGFEGKPAARSGRGWFSRPRKGPKEE